MSLHQVAGWIMSNPWLVLGIVCWLIANAAPRPNPASQETRAGKVFWTLIDRISVLTAETVPGKLKWILMPSPLPPVRDRITHPDLQPVVLTNEEPTDPGKPPTKGSL